FAGRRRHGPNLSGRTGERRAAKNSESDNAEFRRTGSGAGFAKWLATRYGATTVDRAQRQVGGWKTGAARHDCEGRESARPGLVDVAPLARPYVGRSGECVESGIRHSA